MKGIVLSCCILAAAWSASAQDKGRDWAQFGRYEEQNKSVEVPSKVVFMGNSITDGWWPADSAFFKANGYINRGIGGQTTSEMLVRFRADVINLQPKAVVILAGINDIARNNGYISIENAFGNIQSMAELAVANGIRPILCSVLPSCELKWRPDVKPAAEVIKLNALIEQYAKKNRFTYVNYYDAMVDERGGLPAKYSNDEVHPTLEGYKVMESIVHKAISKELRKVK